MKTNKNKMIFCKMIVFLGYIMLFCVVQAKDKAKLKLLLMPGVQPKIPNEYLCTAFRVPRPEYIVKFTAIDAMQSAHHIGIFGCDNPGIKNSTTPRLVWNCNYQPKEAEPRNWTYDNGKICAHHTKLIYAWSLNATSFTLPEGVGFKIGKGTGIDYLVIQVHYLHVDKFLQNGTDNSGVEIAVLPDYSRRITKTAGLYALGTGNGTIMPNEKMNFETACRIEEDVVIHPIAFNPHTHALGLMVSGFKIDKNGTWHLIGKRSPQKTQPFYPVEDLNLTIGHGDIIAARCTMYNFRNVSVSIGETYDDEMCDYYMMYWVDRDHPLEKMFCFSNGPQMYSWESDNKIGRVPKKIDQLASQE